ncbi:histidinol-phosphatase HisJ family protein [Candidatus Peregrinibacteria bacterium]|nr:histidinol-phosphatase HisJ family protein [Candidatus Peregrinibacteria bacterium]
MLIDYHIHNHFSPDSDSPTEAIIEKALKMGLSAICITNHSETFTEGEGLPGTVQPDALKRFEKAKQEIGDFQKKYPDLMIGFGGEIQYEDDMRPVTELVEKTRFDFILGSVHNLDGTNISGHTHADQFFERQTEEQAYHRYFEEMLKLIGWGRIDAVAHFDIIKKYGHEYYGPFKPEKYKTILTAILKKMKEKGIGMELNTGSMHRRCRELFPHPTILKWCVEIGIEHFTLGSDAHDVHEIARYFDEAFRIAKDAGIRTLSTYRNRQPTKHQI